MEVSGNPPFFHRAASSVFVEIFCYVSVKHPQSDWLLMPGLAQKGGSADGVPHIILHTEMPFPFHPSKYPETCPCSWYSITCHMHWCGLERPTVVLEECIYHFMSSVTFSWQSRAGGAVQLSLTCSTASADLSPLQAIFYCCCPWGCQVFKLNPRACFVWFFLVPISDITSYGFLTACLM